MARSGSLFYTAGDLIYSGKPFAQAISSSMRNEICSNCFARSSALKFCKACGKAKYCGKKCQVEAWHEHKLECPYLKNLPERELSCGAQVIGNTLLRLKNKNWKDVKDRIGPKEVSFADIKAEWEDYDLQDKSELFYKEVKSLVKQYIGEENMPDDEEKMKEVFLKVRKNEFAISCKSALPHLYTFYIGVSEIGHSCFPNAAFSFKGKKIQIRATKTIRKDSEKVTVSNYPLVFGAAAKDSPFVQDRIVKTCKCEDCVLPYGKSVLTKIIDETRAFSVVMETQNILGVIHIWQQMKFPLVQIQVVENLLKAQEGVLGDTNLLRMRLIAAKCSMMPDGSKEKVNELEKLLRCMKSAFGENYFELLDVYELLITSCQCLPNNIRTKHYEDEMERLLIIIYGVEEEAYAHNVSYMDDMLRRAMFSMVMSAFFRHSYFR